MLDILVVDRQLCLVDSIKSNCTTILSGSLSLTNVSLMPKYLGKYWSISFNRPMAYYWFIRLF